MPFDTLNVYGNPKDYLAFGYDIAEIKKEKDRHRYVEVYVLKRDVASKNRDAYLALEKQYEEERAKLLTYKPMSILLSIILFILGIFPWIIYLFLKQHEKVEIATENERAYAKMAAIVAEAKSL